MPPGRTAFEVDALIDCCGEPCEQNLAALMEQLDQGGVVSNGLAFYVLQDGVVVVHGTVLADREEAARQIIARAVEESVAALEPEWQTGSGW